MRDLAGVVTADPSTKIIRSVNVEMVEIRNVFCQTRALSQSLDTFQMLTLWIYKKTQSPFRCATVYTLQCVGNGPCCVLEVDRTDLE